MTTVSRMTVSVSARVLILVLAVIVVVTGFLVVSPRTPAAPSSIGAETPPQVPIVVSAGRPGSIPVRVGSPTVVNGHALAAAPLAALELWDGGNRVAVHPATSGSPALHTSWEWIPDEPGDHVLFVRAIDAQGRVAQSNAVRVSVEPGGQASRMDLALAAAQEPILALVPPVISAAVVADCVVELDIAGSASPATGMAIYDLAPSAAAFTALDVHAPLARSSFAAGAGPGHHLYTVSAFDSTAEVFSVPVAVDVPPECGAAGWSGEVRLIGGVLHVPEPVDRAYVYATVDDGAAVRIPADPNAFIEAVDGVLDASADLPPLEGNVITLEAWGWKAGELRQLGTGTWTADSHLDLGFKPAISAIIGLSFATSLDLVVQTPGPVDSQQVTETLLRQTEIERPVAGSTTPVPRTFRWSTHLSGVTSVVWQLLPYAPPLTPTLDPPFAIDQGVLVASHGIKTADFTLDLRPYLLGQKPPVDIDAGEGASVQQEFLGTPVLPGTTPPPNSPHIDVPDIVLDDVEQPVNSGGEFVDAGPLSLGGQTIKLPFALANQLYLRVIPLQGSTPAPPSNQIRIDIVPPKGPFLEVPAGAQGPGINPDAYTVTFLASPPRAANPKFARCAVVVELTADFVVHPFIYPDSDDIAAAFANKTPLCYEPPDDGWSPLDAFEAFVEFVADVVDWVSDSYNSIRDEIVAVIAAPCKAIDIGDSACESFADIALTAALVAVGVPPSLPDFSEVMEGMKGDLASAIVSLASQVPGITEACGLNDTVAGASDLETCEELAKAAIEEIIAQVEAQQSKAASEASGFSAPGAILAPDPRGLFQPPWVEITFTRTGDPFLPTTCTSVISMESHVTDQFTEKWPEWDGYGPSTQVDGPLTGEPFLAETIFVPPLDGEGEQATVKVHLAELAQFYESPDAKTYWLKHEYNDKANRVWQLLRAGAQITFEVQGNCHGTATNSPPYVLTEHAGP